MAEPDFGSDVVMAEQGKKLEGASKDRTRRASLESRLSPLHWIENDAVKEKEQGVPLIKLMWLTGA